MSDPREQTLGLSVVVVHYRTPDLLRASLEHLNAELDRISSSSSVGVSAAEVLVVDNSGDANLEEDGRLRVLEPGRNLGYAGGLAHGAEAASGRNLIAMNPDVRVEAGCLAALLAALEAGAAVAGPRFYWDASRRFLLPPGEERGFAQELLRALASRSNRLAVVARRRWRRHARRHWRASEPVPSHELSGALLAFSRQAWDEVGPFDPAYPLYFEETDWLLRARARGLRSLHVPQAVAIHHFDQSAREEPERDRWYQESCRRFRERHHGRLAARLLERVELARESEGDAPSPLSTVPRDPVWIELSPRTCGFPAAAEPDVEDLESWRLPSDVAEHHPNLRLHATLCSHDGRELARSVVAGSGVLLGACARLADRDTAAPSQSA